MAVRVIIAEDEWLVAAQESSELLNAGYEVVAVAKTGTEALDFCIQHHPDLVLMDITMPDMDGLEATRRIMSLYPTCVVVVTANPDLGDAAQRAGAMGYLVKPFTAEKFLSTIAQAEARFVRLLASREDTGYPSLP